MAHKLEKFGVHPECMVERKNTQALHITVEIFVMCPNLDFTARVLFLIPVFSRTSFKLHAFHGNICVSVACRNLSRVWDGTEPSATSY